MQVARPFLVLVWPTVCQIVEKLPRRLRQAFWRHGKAPYEFIVSIASDQPQFDHTEYGLKKFFRFFRFVDVNG
jgi:hypothetical protein